MTEHDFLPIILGSDENAYGTARLFCEAYGKKPLLLCTRRLIPTYYSSLFTLEQIEDLDREDVFPKALKKVLERYKDDYRHLIVVPCSDYYCAMLSRHYGEFEGMISNRFISEELLSTLDTKDRFYALCEKHGMDYPKTYVADPEDRLTAVDRLPFSFPIVVKPENSNAYEYLHCSFEGKKKVFFFNDRESYLKVMESMNASDYKGKLIIQEFIAGGDDSMRVINTYSDGDGKVRAMCLGQPVLEEYAPKTLGNYAAIISRYDADICEKVKTFLEDIGYVGFANLDMKIDRNTGRCVMFEINPRLGRSSYFVRAAGMNMMKYLVEDTVCGERRETEVSRETALWANVPKCTVLDHVFDQELKKEIKDLLKKKKYARTLDCPGDRDPRRIFWIKRYYFGQYKNFKKYFFRKDVRNTERGEG